ncbi:MAG: ATP-binding cassette domain-containing protein [Bacteroidales bacterium]|nr:ATP-binding cassette domain-containing protein [Bacteroidales bacterium]MDT8430644.1 ATP-binding cassette domain-containing protein [Bacteroidales bacterium]
MITLKNLYKKFDDQYVLNDLNMTLEKGKCNVVIGQSGSGKTVLMKSIVGLLEIDSGEILYDERNFTRMGKKERQLLRKEMGMLFQGGALFDSLTVEENVMFPLNMFTSDNYSSKLKRVDFCLERVGLRGVNQLMTAELSGGMRKRAAIARAIALSPRYLFCDEPNSGLDPRTAIRIDNLISEITREYDITTLVNSHDMNSVLEIGDKVIYIYQGCQCWEGTKEEVLHTDNEALNNFVFATRMAQQIKDI